MASGDKAPLSKDQVELLAEYAAEWEILRDLSGWEFCLTGKMSMPRWQMERLIKAAGGRVSNTVTGTTDVLVYANEDNDPNSVKARGAKRVGAVLLSEAELVEGLLAAPHELDSGHRGSFLDPRTQR